MPHIDDSLLYYNIFMKTNNDIVKMFALARFCTSINIEYDNKTTENLRVMLNNQN